MIPTLWITCQSVGDSDIHGQPLLNKPRRLRVAPVKLHFGSQHTTVRTDSSATHGHAQEDVSTVVVLTMPGAGVVAGDILTVKGNKVLVNEVRDQMTPAGKLDHHEVRCSAWK